MTADSRAILSVAGSDPSGGAGIQADLKTFASLGVYGGAAISCLTVQNSLGIYRIQPVAPELVKEQINQVLADLPVSHIKTGMLGTPEVAEAVGECLAGFDGTVICDPVLKASDGHDLLTPAGLFVLADRIIANAAALTPNFQEFQALTGLDSRNDEDITAACAGIFSRYPRLEAIIVKGGHRREELPIVTDLLFLRDGRKVRAVKAERKRVETVNSHGTGCTFASALAAYHLKTGDWQQAFQLAGDYVGKLLRLSAARRMGHGTGPLWHHLSK
ncbi:MAG: bifunctional hydroxymethylpyrimidine kinase/phosphomethylpyrimidine kinase [Desulfurivibrionaceae bacterium]|nr:bifunctional hydroxymethylpyrimidine kinase/phosphomethylpyrimidine kinase [Desulfurivibrionaceae bacterium]